MSSTTSTDPGLDATRPLPTTDSATRPLHPPGQDESEGGPDRVEPATDEPEAGGASQIDVAEIDEAAATAPATAPVAATATTERRFRFPWTALRVLAAWIVALAVLTAAGYTSWWLIQPQLGKPYVYDEAAFAFAGHAVAQTGVPYSNVGHLQTEVPGDFSKRFNWALWHPPLYIYALGYAYRFWGETETVARMVGVICNTATAALIFLTGTFILWRRTLAAPIYAAAGTALYMLNPLVIQSALMLDIDGTVLVSTVTLLASVYLLVLSARWPLRHPMTWLLYGLAASAFGLALWAKMTTALAILGVAAACRLLKTRPWQPWRVLVELPVIGLAGAGLFMGTWWLACASTGMPFDLPFQILSLELHDATRSAGGWRENPGVLLDLVTYVALWVSPYLILLFVWAGLSRIYDLLVYPLVWVGARLLRRPARPLNWGMWAVDVPLMAGGAIGVVYLIKLASSFPKYHIAMMPFWAIGLAYLLYRFVPRITWWEPAVYGVVLAGMAGYFVSFVGDQYVLFRGWGALFPPMQSDGMRYLAESKLTALSRLLAPDSPLPIQTAQMLIVWPAALGCAFLVLGAALGRSNLPRQLAILGVLLTLAWGWGVGLAQRAADYSTGYNYGTAGQRDIAQYLDTIIRLDEPYVSPKEVAYYTHEQRFVDQDTWWEHISRLSQSGVTTFDGSIAGYQLNVVALFLWDPILGQIAHSYLDAKWDVSFQSGPYVVFVKTVD